MNRERSWEWFKRGWPYDCTAMALSCGKELSIVTITVFVENKDKEEARSTAKKELARYGYQNIDVHKIVPRF